MGIGDLISNAKLRFTADTAPARAEIGKLINDQEKLGKSMQDAADTGGKGLESTLATWTKVAGAAAAAVGAWKLAQVGIEEFDKAAALGEATQGVRLDGLRNASRGLRTDMDLLTFAAKTNAGAHKLNQEQMELAIKAMEVYEDRGHDAAEVTEAITNALVKGQARGLKAFGLEIDETASKAEQFDAIMKGLAKDVNEAGAQTDVGSDAMKRSGVEFSNAMSQIKQSIGEIVMALQPLIGALAKVSSIVAEVVHYVAAGPQNSAAGRALAAKLSSGQEITKDDLLRAQGIDPDRVGNLEALGGGTSLGGLLSGQYNAGGLQLGPAAENAAAGGGEALSSEAGISAITREIWQRREKERQEKQKVAAEYAKALGMWKGELDKLRAQDEWERTHEGGLYINREPEEVGRVSAEGEGAVGAVSSFSGQGILAQQRQAAQLKQDLAEIQQIAAGIAYEQRTTILESLFGPIEEIDAYQTAFQGLTGAAVAGYAALVTGSESVSAAIRKSIAQFLLATGSQMLIEALKHGAYAIASLIPGPTYNPAAASGHALSAAKFAAGAAAAGIAASALGGGGGVPGSVSGAAGGYSSAPVARSTPLNMGGGGGGGRPIVVLAGDEWSDDSARSRQRRIMRAIERAHQSDPGIYQG